MNLIDENTAPRKGMPSTGLNLENLGSMRVRVLSGYSRRTR